MMFGTRQHAGAYQDQEPNAYQEEPQGQVWGTSQLSEQPAARAPFTPGYIVCVVLASIPLVITSLIVLLCTSTPVKENYESFTFEVAFGTASEQFTVNPLLLVYALAAIALCVALRVLIKVLMAHGASEEGPAICHIIVLAITTVLSLWWCISFGASASAFADAGRVHIYAAMAAAGDWSIFTNSVGASYSDMADAFLYFYQYPYQAGVFWLYYYAYQIFGTLSGPALIVLNVIANELTLLSACYISDRMLTTRAAKIIANILLGAFFPLYLLGVFLYGNTLGLMLVMVFSAMQVKCLADMKANKPLPLIAAVGAASLIPLALMQIIKSTYVLFAIAAVITWAASILFDGRRLERAGLCAIAAIVLVLSSKIGGLSVSALENKIGGSLGDGLPTSAWIMIGTSESQTYEYDFETNEVYLKPDTEETGTTETASEAAAEEGVPEESGEVEEVYMEDAAAENTVEIDSWEASEEGEPTEESGEELGEPEEGEVLEEDAETTEEEAQQSTTDAETEEKVKEFRMPGWWDSEALAYYRVTGGDTEQTNEICTEHVLENFNTFLNDPAYALSFFTTKLESEWADPTFQSLYYSLLARKYTVDASMTSEESNVTDPEAEAAAAKEVGDTTSEAGRGISINKLSLAKSPYERLITKTSFSSTLRAICDFFQSVVVVGACMAAVKLFKDRNWVAVFMLVIFFCGFGCYLLWEAKSVYTLPFFFVLIPLCAFGLEPRSSNDE